MPKPPPQTPIAPPPPTSTRQDILKGGCPPGFKRVNGKCVQKGVGPDYRP